MGRGRRIAWIALGDVSSRDERCGVEMEGDEECMQKLLLPLLSSESSDGMEDRGLGEVQQGC